MAIKAEVKGGKLIITADIDESGVASKSGKTQVHVSTRGNMKTDAVINGKPATIGLNVYTHKD